MCQVRDSEHTATPRTFWREEATILGAVLSVTGQTEFVGFVGMGVGKSKHKRKRSLEQRNKM